MKRTVIAILVPLLCIFSSASAQGYTEADDTVPAVSGMYEKPSLSGYIRGLAWGSPGKYDYLNLFGEVALQAKGSTGRAIAGADIRAREGLAYGERTTLFEIKEAYAGYSGQKLDILAGNQIVTWGKADGFNPTNTITPTDYFLMTDDPDDQKLSNFLLLARLRPVRNTSVELIAIPFFKPSVYRFELFDMGEGVSFTEPLLPETTVKNGALAAKIDVTLQNADFSISCFNGFDPNYGFDIDSLNLAPSTYLTYKPDYYRKTFVGFDLSVPLRRTIIRAEAAFNNTSGYKGKMYIPNPDLYYVAGIEREFLGITAILQYIGKYTLDYEPLATPVLTNPLDPLAQMQYAIDLIEYNSEDFNRQVFHQQEETNHAVSLSLVRSFAFETISAKLTGYYNITSEEMLVHASMDWKVTDVLKASFGGQYMYGPDGTLFEKAGDVMNGVYAGLKVALE